MILSKQTGAVGAEVPADCSSGGFRGLGPPPVSPCPWHQGHKGWLPTATACLVASEGLSSPYTCTAGRKCRRLLGSSCTNHRQESVSKSPRASALGPGNIVTRSVLDPRFPGRIKLHFPTGVTGLETPHLAATSPSLSLLPKALLMFWNLT